MNKTKAYKDLQRRQTKKLNELLISLCSTERGWQRPAASAPESALLAVDFGAGVAGESGLAEVSSLTGISHSAAAMAYVSTMLPKIGSGGDGTGIGLRQPPPWSHASLHARPATAACFTSSPASAATTSGAGESSQRARRPRVGSCRTSSASTPLPTATSAVLRDSPKGARPPSLADGGEPGCTAGGRLNARPTVAPSCGGSGGSASDCDGHDVNNGHDRKAVIFPTASQMRQLLSLIDASRSYASGNSGRARRPAGRGDPAAGAGATKRRGSSSAVPHPGDGARPDGQLIQKPPTASEVHAAVDSGAGVLEKTTGAAVAAGQQVVRPSRPTSKQVSFVDLHPSQVLYFSPPPPSSPSPHPSPASPLPALARQDAPETDNNTPSSPPTPLLSEKNLLLHAAALAAAPAAACPAQPGRSGIGGGGGGPGIRVSDDRTISWIRERQIAGELFSGIPEEDEHEVEDA